MTSEEAYEKFLDDPNVPRLIMPLDAFLAAWRMAGEEAAKLAENERTPSGQYMTLNAGRIIAAAIRAHFRDIRKHYDLTEGEPEVDPK